MFKSISNFDAVSESPHSDENTLRLSILGSRAKCMDCFKIVQTCNYGNIIEHRRPKTPTVCQGSGKPRDNIRLECIVCNNDFFQRVKDSEINRHLNGSGHICPSYGKVTIRIRQGNVFYCILWEELK